MSCEKDDLSEKLVECLNEMGNLTNELYQWTESIQDLSNMKKAFQIEEGKKLHGKTILDIGTGGVKPLYIALNFEPDKIIGINEQPYSFAPEIEQNSKLLTKTKIHFYACNFFDDENLKKILRDEKIEKFDFVLVSKTLHHLRSGKCHLEHEHRKDEKCCKYKFEVQNIFDRLLQLGKRVIIYESFYPQEKDEDNVRGRGGYLTTEEWITIFTHLLKNYSVEFVRPLKCQLDEKEMENVIAKLRQVDYVCFYVVV